MAYLECIGIGDIFIFSQPGGGLLVEKVSLFERGVVLVSGGFGAGDRFGSGGIPLHG